MEYDRLVCISGIKYKLLFAMMMIIWGRASGQMEVSSLSPDKCGVDRFLTIEEKIEALLGCMMLEEKIGQMIQVRHFDDIADDDIRTEFIGSVIHTQGPTPGHGAAEWQARFTELQQEALSTRLGIPLLFAVDAIHGQNTYEGATIFPHNIGMGATGNPTLV